MVGKREITTRQPSDQLKPGGLQHIISIQVFNAPKPSQPSNPMANFPFHNQTIIHQEY